MTKLGAIGLAACLAVAVGGCRTTGSVADFVPDGRTGDAIQRAIDAANAAGGGRVTLERGIYESGTIYLKSHVELHIPEGAVLRGAARPEAYDDVDDPRITKAPEKSKKAFIACIGAEDVAITGSGVIDGQGPCFYDTTKRQWGMYAKPPHPRPRMIEFVKCRNVRFSDITFKDSPGWTCWIRMCDDFSAERVKIHADQLMINNDGFHMDGCRRVKIRNCDLKTGDDCIVMRAIQSPCGDSRLCEDMLVEDCNLNSKCQCIRLGCPSDGTIRNGVFRRLKMSGVNGVMSGHPVRYLQDGDHGSCRMENLLVEDCEIDVSGSPISFWVEPGITLGTYGNTTFRNISVKGKKPIKLQGTGDSMLENLVFENVRGNIDGETPLETKSVRNVTFHDFAVTSSGIKAETPAVNTNDGWERVR